MTVFHLRDLVSSKRKKITCDKVKIYQAPQYKELKIEEMLKFAKAYPDVELHLPSEEREVLKLHRDYVSSVIYTVVGKPFKDWVDLKIRERNAELE